MRILVVGGGGMLGHKVVQVCRERFETWATLRSTGSVFARSGLLDISRMLAGVDTNDADALTGAVARVRPDVIINAVGIVKQLPEAKAPIPSLLTNSLLPHRLASLADVAGARLIHISTDCVFSGRSGMYREADPTDAEDLYGRSKLLGEVNRDGCLTLRTSIIGRELGSTSGLVEWFLSNRGGTVDGYETAIYSGLTTIALAGIIAEIIENRRDLSGLYHVSSEPINKLDLLRLLNTAYHADVMIRPSSAVRIDRSLDSRRFREETGWKPKGWPEMIEEMAADPTPYDEWRHSA